MEALAIILVIVGFLIMVIWHEEDSVLAMLGLVMVCCGMIGGIIADKLKQSNPEYKLQQIKNQIDEIHADSVNIQKESQRKLWIWKRTKELEDSLIKLR